MLGNQCNECQFERGYSFYVVLADKEGHVRDIVPYVSRQKASEAIRRARRTVPVRDPENHHFFMVERTFA